jgi:hypothetical protein
MFSYQFCNIARFGLRVLLVSSVVCGRLISGEEQVVSEDATSSSSRMLAAAASCDRETSLIRACNGCALLYAKGKQEVHGEEAAVCCLGPIALGWCSTVCRDHPSLCLISLAEIEMIMYDNDSHVNLMPEGVVTNLKRSGGIKRTAKPRHPFLGRK